jgi:hypothetical protein
LPNISFAHGNPGGIQSIKLHMNTFHIILALLFTVPAFSQNYVSETQRNQTSCKGVVHGIVLGRDGKPWGGINLVLEPVGDYDYVLPRVRTDQQGQYRFEEVCDGKWGVFVEDKEAGYPHSGRYMNWFLYGVWSPQVEVTDKKLEAQFNVSVPPKPGQLHVRLITNNTKAKVTKVEVQLRASRKRWTRLSCEDSDSSLCEGDYFLVPPDQDVKLHITSKGFHEWRGSAGRGKTIRVASGDVLTIDAELDPIEN